MKTITFILATFISQFAFANDEKYIEQMTKQIQAVYTAQTIEELQPIVNTFDRIAGAEKTKWEPYYYSAFGSVMMATRETEATKKDGYLDMALAAIEKGKKIKNEESELVALEGFVHMIRVTVDPATRGQQYSSMAFQTYNKALNMNPENPRALGFLAQMQLGTARFFGSSTDEACGTAKKALEKFATYKSENPLAPKWGKGSTEGVLKNCN
jgi:tetratricopeptide (TPR) repeat protein